MVPEAPARRSLRDWLFRSLAARGVLLIVLFAALPVLIYQTFSRADDDRQRLLIETIRVRGLTVGRALEERLQRADAIPMFRLGEELSRFQTDGISLRLLFRPAEAPNGEGFFYVASAPAVGTADLDYEKTLLAEAGVLDNLPATCAGDVPLALRNDRGSRGPQLISSITPVRTVRGCWALVVSNELVGETQQRLGKPYWQNPEVGTAAALYALFAALVLIVALDLARVLARFVRTARGIASGQATGGFMVRGVPPELDPVGRAFDGMVASLRETAGELRVTAEENAHAFKSPLGTIRQALEPIRFRLGAADARARQALGAIDQSLDRLDGLVRLARNLDAATADRLDPPRDPVDLAILIEDVVETYASAATARGVGLVADLAESGTAPRGGRLIADALGQGIENALGFAPKGGTVRLRLQRQGRRAVIAVEDDGPGVPPEKLGEIFNRHASFRPGADPTEMHFGLGLWVVQRNMAALGGSVTAANRPTGGFILTLTVPVT